MRSTWFPVFLFFLMVMPLACDKDKDQPQIPYAYVDIYIKPNSTEYLELNPVGGWVYLTADYPSRGIVVYRVNMDEFMAYERTCPHDPDKACARIQVESSGTTVIDSCCMSRFILHDGSPFQGPSKRPLKQYRTHYDGINLRIYN